MNLLQKYYQTTQTFRFSKWWFVLSQKILIIIISKIVSISWSGTLSQLAETNIIFEIKEKHTCFLLSSNTKIAFAIKNIIAKLGRLFFSNTLFHPTFLKLVDDYVLLSKDWWLNWILQILPLPILINASQLLTTELWLQLIT